MICGLLTTEYRKQNFEYNATIYLFFKSANFQQLNFFTNWPLEVV